MTMLEWGQLIVQQPTKRHRMPSNQTLTGVRDLLSEMRQRWPRKAQGEGWGNFVPEAIGDGSHFGFSCRCCKQSLWR